MAKHTQLTHDQLTILAEKWLKKQNCGVTFNDKFKALTTSGEQPDALGMRQGASILVECKCSRQDYLIDAKKTFRMKPELGMGDWRFFLCPQGLIQPEELPSGWGLLWEVNGKVTEVKGVPSNIFWQSKKPFTGNKEVEFAMLYSATRKLTTLGLFNEIYKKKRK